MSSSRVGGIWVVHCCRINMNIEVVYNSCRYPEGLNYHFHWSITFCIFTTKDLAPFNTLVFMFFTPFLCRNYSREAFDSNHFSG